MRIIATLIILYLAMHSIANIIDIQQPSQSTVNHQASTKTSIDAQGERISNRCIACHDFSGTQNKIGPHLSNIINRPAAAIKNYNYSSGMKTANLIWNEDNLIQFLTNPQEFIPGTTMGITPLTQAEASALVNYLKSENQ